MSGRFRLLKIGGIGLVIGLLLGGGLAIVHVYYFASDPAATLKSGQEAYDKGLKALTAGDGAAAALHFSEADLLAQKTSDELQKQAQLPTLTTEARGRIPQQHGEAYWLRARALRDQAFAQALKDAKPINETTDSTTGEKFRSMLQVPDAEARNDALGCLFEAAKRLTKSEDVQKEALRNALVLQPLQWNLVEPLARNVVALDPKNSKALGVLARYEYEQPPTDAKDAQRGPTPLEKRSKERMLKAREHLKELKDTGNYPLWRTLYLEAELDQWFAQLYAAQKDGKKQQEEEQALRALLLDSQSGALQRARQGEGLTTLSTWDIDGVFGLHLMALDLTIADQRKGAVGTDKVLDILDTTLKFCDKMAGGEAGTAAVEQAALTAVRGASKLQPLVALAPPPRWRADVQEAQALAHNLLDKNLPQPAIYGEFAQLLEREAQLQGNRNNKTRQDDLRKQALQWVEDGLKAGKDANLPSAQLAELNALAAEMKTVMGVKREDIAPNLEALRQSKLPGAPAFASLLEGAIAEREGRLEKARQSLEQVLSSPNPELTLRAHMVLANVYLGLGQPDRALASLREVEKSYERFEQLSAQEKAWALEFMRSPDTLSMLLVIANLDTARTKILKFVQQSPNKPVPGELVATHEKDVQRLLKKLPPQTPQERTARQALVGYYAATARRDKARDELAALRTDYPGSVDVLRLEVALLMQPDPKAPAPKPGDKPDPKLIETADGRIQHFLADNPGDVAGRLFWAEWLLRTNRADKAVAYLQDPANFPGGKDDVYYRVLAAALAGTGDREESMKVLQHLPHNPAVDAALIQVAGTKAEQEKAVGEAMARYESNGLFRYWDAALAFNAGKYAEAADGFARAEEFTRVKALAQDGLRRALVALAQQDPAKAKELAAQKLKESSDDPGLLLCEAYACLQLDEVGSPTDAPERLVTMAALLNAWEKRVLQAQQDRVQGPLTKAEYWTLANRPDIARDEVTRAFKQDPANEGALRLGLVLALDAYDVPRAREQLSALEKAHPDDVQTLWLRGQVQERADETAEAIKTYQELTKKDSAYRSGAYARLVVLLEKQADKQTARDALQEWRKGLPNDVSAARVEVYMLAADNQLDSARKKAEQFLDEQVKLAQDRVAAAKPAAGADPAVTEKLKQAIVDNARLTVQFEMARAFAQAKAWDEAEAWVRRVLEKQLDSEAAGLVLGDIYLGRKAWQQARDQYAKVFEKHQTNFVAGNNVAWLLATRLNDVSGAYKIVEQIRKGRFSGQPIPGDRLNPEFLDTLGVVCRKLGTPEALAEMRDVFEAARKRYANDPRMCLYLGCAYAGLQQTDKAEDQFTAAVSLAGPKAKNGLSPEQRQTVVQEVEQARKKMKGA
jgi:lipopolysaccharide biosynthesis regulator YciM